MTGHITLTRKSAKIKLQSATRAEYFFQWRGGARYVQIVPVDVALAAFQSNEKMRLKIRLEDSVHFAYSVKNRSLEHGYIFGFI